MTVIDLEPGRPAPVPAGRFRGAGLEAAVWRADGARALAADQHYLWVSLGGGPARLTVGRMARGGAAVPAEAFAYLPAAARRAVTVEHDGPALEIRFVEAWRAARPALAPLADQTGPLHLFDAALVSVAGLLHDCLRTPEAASRIERAGALIETVLTRLAQCAERTGCEAAPRAPAVQVAAAFIEANLAGTLTLDVIARRAGVSRYHFARQFRAAMGTSVHRFVIDRRCARAAHLLRTTDEPIAQIACAVGFGSQSHMTTVMRRHLGRTPGAMRRGAAVAAG